VRKIGQAPNTILGYGTSMDTALGRDRLRELIDLIVGSLDEDVDGAGIAAKGCLSRYHFDRLVSAAIGESPGAFRRRLLLERAAWELCTSRASITHVALSAGYLSVEGFTRAFGRAHGTTPHRYRQAPHSFRLNAPNGVHFHPPGGITFPGPNQRSRRMDFVDRIVEHDIWFTTRLLNRAGDLRPEALDRPVLENWSQRHTGNQTTLRSLLNEMVANKENWSAALNGRPAPNGQGQGLDEMKRRFETAGKEFVGLVRRIRDRGEWDAGFIDALCDPPESFTYGGMLAHVATFSAFRRTMAVFAFRELGVDDLGLGDPIDWERSLA
jgi:AraC-like DNA-binding protein